MGTLRNIIQKFHPELKERLGLQQSLRVFVGLIEDH